MCVALVLGLGCHDQAKPTEPPIASADAAVAPVAVNAVASADATVAAVAPAPVPGPAAPADAAVAAIGSSATSSIGASSGSGVEMIDSAKLIFRVVACGGDGPLPDAMSHGDAALAAKLQKIVDAHCAALKPYMDKFRAEYFDTARKWFVAHEPKDLPTTVVYPFGGGDVVSALVAFPDATEITTMSLELAGDPRHLTDLSPADLEKSLHAFRVEIGALIWVGSNSSINLSDQQRNAIPAQLSSHLLGLATGGYEPTSVRYFVLADDGAIHYLDQSELDADTKNGKSLRGNWKSPAFAQSFANVEVRYRKIGETTERVHRHIAWNLANDNLVAHPEVLKHLEAKGKVSICVKGASYLLWLGDFSTIRKYLLDHLVWMVSDSTGIPPNLATGMHQEAFGTFDAPIIDKVEGRREDFASRKLWAATKQPMPFRFGYLDKHNHKHVMITTPAAAPATP